MGAVIRVGWGWGSGVVIALSTLVVGRPGGHCRRGGCIVDTGDGVVVVGGGLSMWVVVMVVVVASLMQVVMVVMSSM